MKMFLTLFIFCMAFPPVLRAQPPSLDNLQKSVLELQSQLAAYHARMESQSKMIEIQGKEIAELKNRVATKSDQGAVFIPSKDHDAFKRQVQDAVRDIRLSENHQTPEEKELITIYDDGFYLKGKDDTLKIGGWYQQDINIYEKGNEGNSRFRNRRARLDIRGVLEDYFEYRLFTQFAGTAANLQEAWLMYKYFPSARLKIGQFKVPFSLESQYSSLWTDFIEKSIGVANLEPAEDLGAMIYGNPFGGRVEYAVGAFNGRARTLEDNNDNSDLAGRLVLAPFKKSKSELLRELYVGGSVTSGHSDETLAATGFTTSGGSRFATYSAGTRHADHRSRFGGELQWIFGPGDIKAEYLTTRFNAVERLGIKEDVVADGWYVSGSYILTGEKKVRDKWIDPKEKFSIKDGGWGAWEAAARFEQFYLNDAPFAVSLLSGARRVDAYTLGINWWPNKHIRLMFDYVLNDFSESVLIGSDAQDSEHLWLSRVQYNF